MSLLKQKLGKIRDLIHRLLVLTRSTCSGDTSISKVIAVATENLYNVFHCNGILSPLPGSSVTCSRRSESSLATKNFDQELAAFDVAVVVRASGIDVDTVGRRDRCYRVHCTNGALNANGGKSSRVTSHSSCSGPLTADYSQLLQGEFCDKGVKPAKLARRPTSCYNCIHPTYVLQPKMFMG